MKYGLCHKKTGWVVWFDSKADRLDAIFYATLALAADKNCTQDEIEKFVRKTYDNVNPTIWQRIKHCFRKETK